VALHDLSLHELVRCVEIKLVWLDTLDVSVWVRMFSWMCSTVANDLRVLDFDLRSFEHAEDIGRIALWRFPVEVVCHS